ncbi:2-dehydro-3-deoxyglucarate aldolase [Pigmentiphaga soli]|uniref:2-dehydro-3-deoxyglucarate aldolase n=1 Tax=Pigmentiphaga soli TaxID=1007095 RepID=A0ABP8HH77_9BURK
MNPNLDIIEAKRKRIARLKARMASRQLVLGAFVSIAHASYTEAIAYSGLDFLIIDSEHGSAHSETIEQMIRACDVAGCLPFARVPLHEPALISRVLDMGAAGVVVPIVESVEGLESAFNAVRFPPVGRRGVSNSVRAGAYGFLPLREFLDIGNRDVMLAAQIETRQGLANARQIVERRLADIIFIGPSDLSIAMGHPGDVSAAPVQEAIQAITGIAHDAGVPLGAMAVDAAAIGGWLARGIPFIAMATTIPYRAVESIVRDRSADGQTL